MRIMDLRQLEYFLRVAQRRNISVAAAELNITQPSLTKSIKLLEKELGVRLFDRVARGVELTDYGQTLLRHAEAVHVQVGDAFVVAELPQHEDRRGLEVNPLTSDELGVCCRADHPLAGRRRVAMEDLLRYPWVLLPRTTRAQRRLSALFAALDLAPPQTVVETDSHAFLLSLLRYSDALTFTVSKTVDIQEGAGLVMLAVPKLKVRRQAGVVTRRGGWLSPAAAHVIDNLAAICAAHPQN